MSRIKLIAGSGFASLALMLGLLVAPVSAQQTCTVQDVTLGVAGCLQVTTTDDSPTNGSGNQANNGGTVVDGNCNIISTINSGGAAVGGAGGAGGSGVGTGVGGVLGSATGTGTGGNGGAGGSASTTINNNVSADCSTHNVTNVTNAVAEADEAEVVEQVAAPKGGVHAGLGAEAVSGISSLFGLAGSVGAVGFGLRSRRQEV